VGSTLPFELRRRCRQDIFECKSPASTSGKNYLRVLNFILSGLSGAGGRRLRLSLKVLNFILLGLSGAGGDDLDSLCWRHNG
jgi:hypothetical protein